MAASSGHLGSGKINLGFLRDYYRRELLECLDKCHGTKVIVLQVNNRYCHYLTVDLCESRSGMCFFPTTSTGFQQDFSVCLVFVSDYKLISLSMYSDIQLLRHPGILGFI